MTKRAGLVKPATKFSSSYRLQFCREIIYNRPSVFSFGNAFKLTCILAYLTFYYFSLSGHWIIIMFIYIASYQHPRPFYKVRLEPNKHQHQTHSKSWKYYTEVAYTDCKWYIRRYVYFYYFIWHFITVKLEQFLFERAQLKTYSEMWIYIKIHVDMLKST